jgi:hypothetical protein
MKSRAKRYRVWVLEEWRVLTNTDHDRKAALSIARIWGKIPGYRTKVLPEGQRPRVRRKLRAS